MPDTNKNSRELMELAVEVMHDSIQESRIDKSSPLVGAVLVKTDGSIEKAYRGEFSEGDHAEYTLLERKLISENLAGTSLYTTLEPCAPGARSASKTSCAERIVNRRISKVWIGIEDPDPLVDKKGIQHLLDNGIAVELFDHDLQDDIRRVNKAFIQGAVERANRVQAGPIQNKLGELEKPITSSVFDDLSADEVKNFIREAGFNFEFGSDEFYQVFIQLGFLSKYESAVIPTGVGILLFGKNPQIFFPHAVIRGTYKTSGRREEIATFTGSLPKQAKESLAWFKSVIGKQIDRSEAERKTIYDYPDVVVRESILNALAHRSYDDNVAGASIHLVIDDNRITIQSPGGPVKPISLDRMKTLSTPILSKNPKITYAFEILQLSEGRGLGFETFRSLPIEHKLPLPVITYDEPYLIFTFYRAYGIYISDERLRTLSVTEARGFEYIRLNSPITRKSYEENLGIATKTAERNLTHFVELGLVKRIGSGPKTFYELVD